MNYHYESKINYKGFTEAGFTPEDVDMKDMVLTEYIHFWYSRSRSKVLDDHVWIKHENCIENLPFLGIKDLSALSKRFSKLVKLGIITRRLNKKNDAFYKLTIVGFMCIDGHATTEYQTYTPDSTPNGFKTMTPRFQNHDPNGSQTMTPMVSKPSYIIEEDTDKKDTDKNRKSPKMSIFIREQFEQVILAYGNKSDRTQSEWEFVKLKPNPEKTAKMVRVINFERDHDVNTDLKYKKKLSRWLKDEDFENYPELFADYKGAIGEVGLKATFGGGF